MRELLAGLVPGLPEATTRSIIARADGIPLYAVETIRMLLSDGRLREVDGQYEPVGELGELAVPETLQALIAARLDGLAPADRALLQDAAVLGQSFTLAGLAAVSGQERVALETRLRDMGRLELIGQEVDPRSPERGMYAFVQALIREVAYNTLAKRDRRARHLAAARFFESLDDQELAGALAAHYVAAYRAAPDGPEGEAVAIQARIALRAAADRAEALGSPRQAITFYEQALEISPDDADRADLLDRAGEAATAAARSDLATEFLRQSTDIRSRLGDRVALARTIGLHAAALTEGRHREAAVALLRPAVDSLGDLADHPVGIQLMSSLGRNLMLNSEYDAALTVTDRALAASERIGLARIAAETLATKGQIAMYLGRHWEARALLEGARILADEHGLTTIKLRAMNYLAATIAHDDVAAALRLERAAVELARQLGRRSAELVALGNAAEDARRTGEWAWAISELEAALQLDIDDETRLTLRSAAEFYRVLQGISDPVERARILSNLENLDDVDVASGAFELRAIDALTRGDWREAHDQWMRVVGRSDLNTPYVLPRAAHAAVVAGDVGAARLAIDQLNAIGTRGRTVDADRAATRAGIAALEGDPSAAMAGYRTAIAAWHDLGLPFDEAMGVVSAVTRLGPDAPGMAEWIETARATFGRLEAAPLLALLDAAVEGGRTEPGGPTEPLRTSTHVEDPVGTA
jgi:Predicted ATPase